MTIIYALTDPRTDKIRYVGKTDTDLQLRIRHHESEARNKSGTHRLHWLQELAKYDLAPGTLVLEEVESENWQNRERWWISYGHAQGWPLTNGTAGGEGLINPSKEVRKKLSQAAIGNNYGSGKRSDEFCARMAEVAKETKNALGHTKSKEACKEISNSMKVYYENGGDKLYGESNGSAKLSEDDVREIRRIYALGGMSYAKIGKLFGVTRSAAGMIVRHERWSHIKDFTMNINKTKEVNYGD